MISNFTIETFLFFSAFMFDLWGQARVLEETSFEKQMRIWIHLLRDFYEFTTLVVALPQNYMANLQQNGWGWSICKFCKMPFLVVLGRKSASNQVALSIGKFHKHRTLPHVSLLYIHVHKINAHFNPFCSFSYQHIRLVPLKSRRWSNEQCLCLRWKLSHRQKF